VAHLHGTVGASHGGVLVPRQWFSGRLNYAQSPLTPCRRRIGVAFGVLAESPLPLGGIRFAP